MTLNSLWSSGNLRWASISTSEPLYRVKSFHTSPLSLNWTSYFKPAINLWTEGAQSLAAYHRRQRSTKSDTAAFQGLAAQTMSRFVMLGALTRSRCQSQCLRWNMTGSAPPPSDRADAGGCLGKKKKKKNRAAEKRLLHISESAGRSQVIG